MTLFGIWWTGVLFGGILCGFYSKLCGLRNTHLLYSKEIEIVAMSGLKDSGDKLIFSRDLNFVHVLVNQSCSRILCLKFKVSDNRNT